MFKIKAKGKTFYFLFFIFYFFLVLSGSFCWADVRLDKTGPPNVIEGVWDPARYISIDEIKPGMEAYCLTEYGTAGIEKFDLEVLSVVRNYISGRDVILVQGTDERFIYTGPVAGCSGSPVYIDGRLAGALAFAFFFSKDPIYGVTPIEDMLKVDEVTRSERSAVQMGFVFDFSRPMDFAEIERQLTESRYSKLESRTNIQHQGSGFGRLPCPLITSGLPVKVCEQLGALVAPFGLMAVSGVGSVMNPQSQGEIRDTQLVPGAALVVPLVTGDMTMTVLGTATEVVGDKVYGFGHGFLGYGPVDLPMATGQIHTVVSSLSRSFKVGSVLEIVGALTTDESAAVIGRIGAKARMISLNIRVDDYRASAKQMYNCQVANNQLLTPMLLRSAVSGAALYLGDFPPEHTIEYKVVIGLKGAESITFTNVSAGVGLTEMIMESIGSVALLMNNPYKEVDIESIDFDVRIVPKNIISHIWSVDLSDTKTKAGQNIKVGVVVESVLAGKKKYQCSLKIPEDLAPGKYELNVCGSYGYAQFLRKTVPYKFIAQSLPSLIEALNNSLQIGRNKLYFLLVLPPRGVVVEQAELPDLPATKALVLQNAKRALKTQPYPHWLERSLEISTVVIDKKVMRITVEK